jgi:hypothetical protein
MPVRNPRTLIISAALLLAACGTTGHDTSNPDWAQAGLPPPPKSTTTSTMIRMSDMGSPLPFQLPAAFL